MIPCNHCGADNPLGTMFCRGCGQRIEVDPNQILDSVKQTQSENRGQQILLTGRNAVAMCGFLFMAAMVVRMVIVPAMPDQRMPLTDPRLGDELLQAPQQVAAPEIPLALGAQDDRLLSWRSNNADRQLQALGIDREQVRIQQRRIAKQQTDSGGFPGPDEISATALAVLALQAYPGDPEIDQAALRGAEWLHVRRRRVIDGSNHQARSLLAMALMERDMLDRNDIAIAANVLGSGNRLDLQALTLPLFSPEQRPKDILVLRRQLGTQPLWLHYLDLFSAEPLVTTADHELFTPAQVRELSLFDAWVWSQTAWLRAAAPQAQSQVLAAWSAPTGIQKEPGDLAATTGALTQDALAVLAICAPVRVPMTRLTSR